MGILGLVANQSLRTVPPNRGICEAFDHTEEVDLTKNCSHQKRKLGVTTPLLWFCFTRLYDWLAKFASFSQLMPLDAKPKPIVLGRTRFPVLDAGYMYLLQVLIG